MSHRIALGGVQFGYTYGVANRTGILSQLELAALLKRTFSAGIDTLDTAIAYGESEKRLGEIGVEGWKVISKLPPVPSTCTNVTDWIRNAFTQSIHRLQINSLYGFLLHNPLQLFESQGKEIFSVLCDFKKEGFVKKIGISIYNPDDLESILNSFEFDLVQVPFNILDRRLLTTGWLSKLKKRNIEVHCRSIFLQGLLLMNESDRPAYFDPWRSLFSSWHSWLEQHSLRPQEACIRYALSHPEIDQFVVGVDHLNHLEELLSLADLPGLSVPSEFANEDLNLINPSNWNLL